MQPLLSPDLVIQVNTLAVQAKGSYIFGGPAGVGKFTTAIWLAKQLNCLGDEPSVCRNCQAIDSGNYPDLIVISPDGQSIGIAQIQTLGQALSLSQYSSGGRRVVIIDSADQMTSEAQNSLLKILEEPPAGTLMILVAEQGDSLLSTVVSRCAKLHFAKLPNHLVSDYLIKVQKLTLEKSRVYAELAFGRIGLAISLAKDPALLQSYQAAINLADEILTASPFQRLNLAGKIIESPLTVDTFIKALANRIRASLRSPNSTQPDRLSSFGRQLEAIERFLVFRRANVNLRPALEGLVLEL